MQIKSIEYFEDKQKFIGELISYNESNVPQPAVILFPAFEGRGEFVMEYARDLAKQGFIVFVADMYGDAEVATTLDHCFKLVTPLVQDRSIVRKRAVLAYQTLLQQPGIDKNKIGAAGFCIGGMCVLELMRSGADLQAGISLHGALKKSDLVTHPAKTKLLLLHGYADPQVPPSQLNEFTEEMAAIDLTDWTFTFFGNAKHSFTDPRTGSFDAKKEQELGREYHKEVAARAFRYVVDFFKEILGK